VKISKRMAGEAEETLGQIAARDLRTVEVFNKYGLDFCCRGNRTLKQACDEKGLDVDMIETELQTADRNPVTRALPYNEWSADFLSDFIVNTHHSYTRKTLPQIRDLALKVLEVHGSSHPELAVIQQLVEEISKELLTHMLKEEQVLFPHIKSLAAAVQAQPSQHPDQFDTLSTIEMMEMEHGIVGKCLEEIRVFSNNYILPDDACASYSLLFRLLNELENDLHLHIHLENNILFPKALEIEKALKQ
jgi:regulator of cell morphogenesis and NO signaling